MPRYQTATEYARRNSIPLSTVKNAIPKALKGAMNGGMIDSDCDCAKEWLAATLSRRYVQGREKVGEPKAKADAGNPSKRDSGSSEDGNIVSLGDGDLDQYLDYTLLEIADKFGTLAQFKDALIARKTIEEVKVKREEIQIKQEEVRIKQEDIRLKELKAEEIEGQIIRKDFVKGHLMGYLHTLQTRLLTDAPKAISARLQQLAEAGAGLADLEIATHDIISGQLKATQERITKKLQEIDG